MLKFYWKNMLKWLTQQNKMKTTPRIEDFFLVIPTIVHILLDWAISPHIQRMQIRSQMQITDAYLSPNRRRIKLGDGKIIIWE